MSSEDSKILEERIKQLEEQLKNASGKAAIRLRGTLRRFQNILQRLNSGEPPERRTNKKGGRNPRKEPPTS